MKTMIIGLLPDYNYPGKFEKWSENNTYYASNFGASLITRTLIKQFDGEFVEDLSDIKSLNDRYDRCVLALATHLTKRRDLTYLADAVEKLDMPVLMPSLGIADYVGNVFGSFELHPSVIRLINLVLEKSSFIGVRGPHTAALVQRAGISKVIPIGCPTLYHNLNPGYEVKRRPEPKDSLVVYHRTLTEGCWHITRKKPLLGQDFLDEVAFTNHLSSDVTLKKIELSKYKKYPEVVQDINEQGLFPKDFDDWFKIIGSKSFVFGPRLHGCIAAIIQGIPALMTARDLRVREIAEFFKIPYLTYEELKTIKQEELPSFTNYEKFNELYPYRYRNYTEFLKENGFGENRLPDHNLEKKISFTFQDMSDALGIINRSVDDQEMRFSKLKGEMENMIEQRIEKLKAEGPFVTSKALHKILRKLPFARNVGKNVRK